MGVGESHPAILVVALSPSLPGLARPNRFAPTRLSLLLTIDTYLIFSLDVHLLYHAWTGLSACTLLVA